jgi:hypothetical protein
VGASGMVRRPPHASAADRRTVSAMNFTPKDQIILLAGLDEDAELRERIWRLPELRKNLERLASAGLLDARQLHDGPDGISTAYAGLLEPTGKQAALKLRHVRLDDLIAEHLPGVL